MHFFSPELSPEFVNRPLVKVAHVICQEFLWVYALAKGIYHLVDLPEVVSLHDFLLHEQDEGN